MSQLNPTREFHGSSNRSNRDNVETAKAFFAAIYANDYDRAFSEYAHPDYQFIVGSADNAALTAAIPWAGHTKRGKSGYMELMKELFSEFDPVSFEAHRYTDAGDQVFVEGHFVFKHRGTGKTVDSDWLTRFDMKDGRIAGGQFYENTYGVAAARVR